MSLSRQADPEFDSLIDEITVDCHDEDEQLTGFEAAFDEDASFPCPGTVLVVLWGLVTRSVGWSG